MLVGIACLASYGPAARAQAQPSPELVKARNCVACHATERKLVGPSFKDIAARYRNDKDAAARLALKIREGGGGAWGVVKMPANPQVSESDSQAIVRWILSLP
ncbi:MAG: c-type cytochrome [Burkholderiaceae bacterium]